jgi:hypothetical protein
LEVKVHFFLGRIESLGHKKFDHRSMAMYYEKIAGVILNTNPENDKCDLDATISKHMK